MNFLERWAEKMTSGQDAKAQTVPFHPMTVLRPWHQGLAFRIADAVTGVCVFGATGSGKTSGVAKHLALGYLANDFGGLVLCAKKAERRQWESWAAEVGRAQDLVIIETAERWRFYFWIGKPVVLVTVLGSLSTSSPISTRLPELLPRVRVVPTEAAATTSSGRTPCTT